MLRLPGHRTSGLDGLEILEEVGEPLGVTLWQLYRDVGEWVNTDAECRGELFQAPLAESAYLQRLLSPVPEEIADSVATAWEAVTGPGDAARSRPLSRALVEVFDWAERNGYDQTAASFATVTATLRPRDADLAFKAGRAERRCGRYHQAEAWFQRSVGLARRAGDAAAYATAYLGWGLLAEERADRVQARRYYVRAWRAAQRGGLRGLVAAARHNLIPLSAPPLPFAEGHAHIVAAYRMYDPRHAPLARLAHDAGGFYTEHGYYALSLQLYLAALPQVTRPAERTAVHSNIARSAAALGRKDLFSDAETAVLNELERPLEHTADALSELALGAYTLGLRRKARSYAVEALRIAEARQSAASIKVARQVIEAIETNTHVDELKDPSPALERFVSRFVRRLERGSVSP